MEEFPGHAADCQIFSVDLKMEAGGDVAFRCGWIYVAVRGAKPGGKFVRGPARRRKT